jgi:hypothetical protein
MVAYPTMKQAAMVQAARYAMLARRTHLLVIGESNELTPGMQSGTQCVERETEASRRARVAHAIGQGFNGNTSNTTAHCRDNYAGGFDCDATTTAPSYTPPPRMRTDTTCTGGDPIPGTEGHILRLSISFLAASEAASLPTAVSALRLLGIPEPVTTPADSDMAPFPGEPASEAPATAPQARPSATGPSR